MILEYLQKYQEELIAKKIDIKEELEMVESKIKETNKFVELLDSTNESYFSDFTPRKINAKNLERMDELIVSKKNLEQSKSKLLTDLLEINKKLLELEKIIKEEKKHIEILKDDSNDNNKKQENIELVIHQTDKLLDIINNVKQYIFVDPMRSKLEIEKIEKLILNNQSKNK